MAWVVNGSPILNGVLDGYGEKKYTEGQKSSWWPLRVGQKYMPQLNGLGVVYPPTFIKTVVLGSTDEDSITVAVYYMAWSFGNNGPYWTLEQSKRERFYENLLCKGSLTPEEMLTHSFAEVRQAGMRVGEVV